MATTYEKVVTVAKTYLGPATEDFVSKQCTKYLKKEPKDLVQSDLAALAEWIGTGATRLMERDKAEALAKKVAAA